MTETNTAGSPSVAELRTQARANLNDGAMTPNYGGNVRKTTEIVCVLRYKREEKNLVDMPQEDLVAGRIAVEVCRDMVRFFGDRDPTTRRRPEGILAQEEEHANDMHHLLVAHNGRSDLSGPHVTADSPHESRKT